MAPSVNPHLPAAPCIDRPSTPRQSTDILRNRAPSWAGPWHIPGMNEGHSRMSLAGSASLCRAAENISNMEPHLHELDVADSHNEVPFPIIIHCCVKPGRVLRHHFGAFQRLHHNFKITEQRYRNTSSGKESGFKHRNNMKSSDMQAGSINFSRFRVCLIISHNCSAGGWSPRSLPVPFSNAHC